ncbi:MAG: hypothetical protein QM581_08255 [Pseudomonas sp.]
MAIRIVDGFGRPVNLSDFQAGRVRDVLVFDVTREGDYRLRASDLGSGHMEVTLQRDQTAKELSWTGGQIEDHLEMVAKYKEEHEAEIRERSAKIAAQRAKKRVRQLCKANGVDTLLTLTYRALETDLARVKADLKEFNRRVLRVLSDFGLVAAFELQKRGAWHVHAATCRVPRILETRTRNAKTGAIMVHRHKSYDLLRAIWRSVTKDRGGSVNLAKTRGRERSPARIAAYIAKYVTKAYAEGEKWTNRWTRYGFGDVPKPVDLGTWQNAREAIESCYALLAEGSRIVSGIWSRWGEWFFLSAEREGSTMGFV